MQYLETIKSKYKQIKTFAILPSSRTLDREINNVADNGGGLIIIGYDANSKRLISTKDFYCDKIISNVSKVNKHLLSSNKVIVNNIEIVTIKVDKSEEYINSFC